MKKNKFSYLAVAIIGAACLLLNFTHLPNNILAWDTFGYYLYLPQVFINQDLGLENIQAVEEVIDRYHSTGELYQANQVSEGKWVIKYTSGMALLYLPFFLIGHLLAMAGGFPVDGYSTPYQYAILSGGMLYTIAGFIVLRKVLLRYYQDRIVAITLLTIYIGTSFFIRTSFYGNNAQSHNWLFAIYVVILWASIRWHETHRLKYILILALGCGICILARPSEIVCLFLPLLWGVAGLKDLRSRIHDLWQKRLQILLFIGILALFGSIQLIYWKWSTGSAFYYSYENAGEGFEFLRPYLTEVLFSYRKGWLVYTPLAGLAIIGIVILYKQNRSIFWAVSTFFVLNLYIISSWSCWWYAESFSSRALEQSLAVMSVPMAASFNYIFNQSNRLITVVISLVVLMLIGLNVFQTWQINNGILHGSRMTKEYYWAIFGKTSITEQEKDLLLVERSSSIDQRFTDQRKYELTQTHLLDMEVDQPDGTSAEQVYTGEYSFKLDESHIYSPTVQMPFHELTHKDHVWLRVSSMVFPAETEQPIQANLVVCFEHEGKSYKYEALDLDGSNLTPNTWQKVEMDYLTPEVRIVQDNLKAYVWLRGSGTMYIDDLKVEVFERKSD